MDDGSYIYTKSAASGAKGQKTNKLANSGSNNDSGSPHSGWVEMPDGTWHRQGSSWSSWSSSSQSGGGGSGVTYDDRKNYENDNKFVDV